MARHPHNILWVAATMAIASLLSYTSASQAASITLAVGPGETYATLAAAVAAEVAGNSYVIQMDPGTYPETSSVVFPAPTVLNAVGVTIIPQGQPSNQKAWMTTTFPLTVNGLTIIGTNTAISESLGGNAAAIREQADGLNTLTVNGAVIESFQDGILTGSDTGNTHLDVVTISNTMFINNGDPNGQTHALYVGDAASLSVTNSIFCGTNTGHDVKSRAASTTVAGSTLFVGTNQNAPAGCAVGSTSLAIDLPNGGSALADKDTIIQGDANQNGALIVYGGEGYVFSADALVVTRTKFTNLGTRSSTAINIFPDVPNNNPCPVTVSISRNTFTNIGTLVNPAACLAVPTHGKKP